MAAGPSNPSAAGGGVMLIPETSYWPIRRLPWGVTANEVTR